MRKGLIKACFCLLCDFAERTHTHTEACSRDTHKNRKEEKAHNFGFIFLCVDKCKLFIFDVNHLPWLLLRCHIGCVKKRSLRRINPCWKITSRYIFHPGFVSRTALEVSQHHKPGDLIILYWLIIPFMNKE